MYVISANYRDRSNKEFPWLIRVATDSVEAALPVRRVFAKDIYFSDSNEAEQGFGCRVVAFAKKAYFTTGKSSTLNVPNEDTSDATMRRMSFGGNYFVDKENRQTVSRVDFMLLEQDRSMHYAIVEDIADGPEEESPEASDLLVVTGIDNRGTVREYLGHIYSLRIVNNTLYIAPSSFGVLHHRHNGYIDRIVVNVPDTVDDVHVKGPANVRLVPERGGVFVQIVGNDVGIFIEEE